MPGYTLEELDALEEGWFFYDHAWSLLFEMMGRIRGESLLDVGCGTGIAASIIQAAMPRLSIAGVEPNDHAAEIWQARGLSTFIGSATDLPLDDDSWDTVLSSHVVEHIEDDHAAVTEIVRVAKRRALIVVPEGNVDAKNFGSPHVRHYDRRNFTTLARTCTPTGWSVETFVIPHPHMANLVAMITAPAEPTPAGS